MEVQKIACPSVDRQKLILDLLVQSKNVKLLISKFRREKIRILGTEKILKNLVQIRIEILESEFRKIFSGFIEYRVVSQSANYGFYCQRYIQKYKISLRYRKYIREIRIPDPQIE
ncbi:hypothetical protein ACO1KB_21370 [Leptospira interrogans serovar Szwajizak]|uniref:hypothetical protein n=1 Tax=Leptospira interrogans TaxID=173 RepID=UPI000345C0AC|nr:hypothetical protein [Leptospira interrogans]